MRKVTLYYLCTHRRHCLCDCVCVGGDLYSVQGGRGFARLIRRICVSLETRINKYYRLCFHANTETVLLNSLCAKAHTDCEILFCNTKGLLIFAAYFLTLIFNQKYVENFTRVLQHHADYT